MSLVTIFTIPKPFKGHVEVIQRNAIESWKKLGADIEVALCGKEHGTAEVAAEYGVKHIAGLAINHYGTPYVNSAFDAVRHATSSELLCYANSDIIFLSDFRRAVHRVRGRRCLLVGRRWDVDLTERWDYSHPESESRMSAMVEERGVPHSLWGLDYFLFRREGGFDLMPPMVVGRPGWDNWMIFDARRRGVPVIDASRIVKAIHQNHDYSHVPHRTGEKWMGVESQAQVEMLRGLMGGTLLRFALVDCTHVMTQRGIRRDWSPRSLRRHWMTLPIRRPWTKPVTTAASPFVRCLDWGWRGVKQQVTSRMSGNGAGH